jgi:hypothetical protein
MRTYSRAVLPGHKFPLEDTSDGREGEVAGKRERRGSRVRSRTQRPGGRSGGGRGAQAGGPGAGRGAGPGSRESQDRLAAWWR